ncbi:unnamed protein product [Polarella glacialis]|uniref:GAF domain-containing protein n=1 Tax=Polarella glacialis TaxID=89957 RepID=A0A813KJS4_POLGL|nr:unnamed protein product [Polarella glacialis]
MFEGAFMQACQEQEFQLANAVMMQAKRMNALRKHRPDVKDLEELKSATFEGLLAELCFSLQVDACVLVTPTAFGFHRLWHASSEFPKPQKHELETSMLFKVLVDQNEPTVISDVRKEQPGGFKADPRPSFRFYAEALVSGERSGTILGTLCLADRRELTLSEKQLTTFKECASRLYALVLFEAGLKSDADDYMLPHMTQQRKVL